MGDTTGTRRTPDRVARRPSLADVAAEAGVSTSTASSALGGTRAVRAETRERVLRAAERLGYVSSRAAGPSRSRRAAEVAVVTDGIASTPYAGRIVQGAQEVARARGILLTIADSGGDPELEARHLRSLAQRGIDGILLARVAHEEVERPAAIGAIPAVLVNAVPAEGWTVPSVAPDEQRIAADAVEHLLGAGHQIVAFIVAEGDGPAARGRYAGFRSAVEWAGLYDSHAVVERATPDAAGGRRMGRRLLDHPPGERPTAILCFNDQVALGVYQAAEALGLEVPRDCSVLAVDDLEIVAASLDPALSTIELPHRAMGRWAMTALLDQLDDPTTDAAGTVLLAGDLVERRSVAPPRRLLAWLNRR